MTELIKYDAAKKMLAEAKSVDEVRSVKDKAMAMRLYAQQAKDKTLEADATEIRLRAERRIGQMIEEQKNTVGLNPGAAVPTRVSEKPTLEEAGIDKNLAHRARGAAALPEDIFDNKIAEMREKVLEGNGRKLPEFRPTVSKEPRTIKMEPVVEDATTFAAYTRRMEDLLRTFFARQTKPFDKEDEELLCNYLRNLERRVREGKFL